MPTLHPLYPHFSNNLQRLLPANTQQLLIALSGGVDSVVLLQLCRQFANLHAIELSAIHINHGLNANADDWYHFCQSICDTESVVLHYKKVTVCHLPRTSIEAEARDKRYKAITPYCQPGTVLLTGHHNDDQVETLLLQLKRGAGCNGLAAMAEKRTLGESVLLRPLLTVSRQQLIDYANQYQLSWIEDDSNLDTVFDRNFLRQQVIPPLVQRWPGFKKALSRSARLCGETQQLCEEIAQQDLAQIQSTAHKAELTALPIEPLLALSEPRRNNLLRFWIASSGFAYPSQQQLQQIWQGLALSRQDANGAVLLNGYQVRRYKGALYLVALSQVKPFSAVDIDRVLLAQQGYAEVAFTKSNEDGRHLVTLTLTQDGPRLRLPTADEKLSFRFDGSGAVCHPVGRAGSRKYKKLMQEYLIPPWNRTQIPLLFYGDQLVAAYGLWLDQRYLQTEDGVGLSLRHTP